MIDKKIPRIYASFIAKNYIYIILVILVITIILGIQITKVKINPLDYKNFLPDQSDTMQNINFIESTFMSTDSVKVLIKAKHDVSWTDQGIVSFVDKLDKKLNQLSITEYTLSYTKTLRQNNNNSVMIKRGEFKHLMNKEEVYFPLNPLTEAKKYMESFSQLNSNLKNQNESIHKLANSSKEINQKIVDIKESIKKLRIKTESAKDEKVSVKEIEEGIDEISSGLTDISNNLDSLSLSLKRKYCSDFIYDPLYSEFTQIPNPSKNDDSCSTYTNKTILESYTELKDIYCNHPMYKNDTKCDYYNKTIENSSPGKLNYSIYDGFRKAGSSIDNRFIPALANTKRAISKTGYGLEGFRDSIVSLNSALKDIMFYLRSIEKGVGEYNNNMNTLAKKTNELSKHVDKTDQNITKAYQFIKDNINTDFEKKRFKLSNKKKFEKFFSSDKSSSVIIVNIKKQSEKKYVDDKIRDVLKTTKTHPKIELSVAGDLVRFNKLQSMIPAEMSKTSIFAAILIILIIMFLLKRPILSILTLSTILFGSIWTFGILGMIGMNLNPATSGVLSMLLGIGIDFGIQLVNEFKKHFKRYDLEKSLMKTMRMTIKPITITTIAAMLGFLAMGFGEVTIMHDMGKILLLGTPLYFLAAITVLPCLLTIYAKFQRGEKE
ncbi:MAG: MMPL family transporter [Nanobdellota archaeon]